MWLLRLAPLFVIPSILLSGLFFTGEGIESTTVSATASSYARPGSPGSRSVDFAQSFLFHTDMPAYGTWYMTSLSQEIITPDSGFRSLCIRYLKNEFEEASVRAMSAEIALRRSINRYAFLEARFGLSSLQPHDASVGDTVASGTVFCNRAIVAIHPTSEITAGYRIFSSLHRIGAVVSMDYLFHTPSLWLKTSTAFHRYHGAKGLFFASTWRNYEEGSTDNYTGMTLQTFASPVGSWFPEGGVAAWKYNYWVCLGGELYQMARRRIGVGCSLRLVYGKKQGATYYKNIETGLRCIRFF